ncbi:MAG: hypothetical protein LIO71_07400 [Ruminococcus sp.]|nr:hypothetical protein [Ruminococcus sp.]
MDSNAIYVVAQDNHEYRVAYIPNNGVTNCNISVTAPDSYSTSQIFDSTVIIDTGAISPTVSI